MVQTVNDCQLCNGATSSRPTFRQTALDFARLYFIGLVELIRQWFFAASYDTKTGAQRQRSSIHALRSANSVVLLTGCTSGIGQQILTVLLDNNIQVIALTHNQEPLRRVVFQQIHMDLSLRESVHSAYAAVMRTIQHISAQRTVVLINCAGIYMPRTNRHFESTTHLLEACLNVNLVNPFAFLELMCPAIDGVVWIGSSSHRVAPKLHTSQCPLHAAKTPFAMYPLSKLLALLISEKWSVEQKKPVLVIHPGIVHTGLYDGQGGIIGGCLRLLMPYLAWDVKQSVSRILQLIDASAFWEKVNSKVSPASSRLGTNAIYWDVVSMMPHPLPPQIRDDEKRTAQARRLHMALQSVPT